MIGFQTYAEVQTNDDHIYLFEFKLDKSAEEAMDQIKEHQYYQRYQLKGKPITCVWVNFDSKKRTVDDWAVEEILV